MIEGSDSLNAKLSLLNYDSFYQILVFPFLSKFKYLFPSYPKIATLNATICLVFYKYL